MTSQALYNRWRSQTFDDLLGQEHITATLRNQIRAGRIGHAYLFSGVRGTGKTSTARILAKAVNCVGQTQDPPCNACHICQSITAGRSLDLIEIDGASNRGIDEIRELRERVNFVPQEARFKVYVIDEVHMLTKEAFNALLKTLEEPPAHVIFVLCTTEAYRLPDTILSRCQRFDFRRASVEMVARKLERICAAEGIAITAEALEFIARRAAGSFRDAESLLDQVAAHPAAESIDLAFVQRVLGVAPAEAITELLRAMLHGDAARGLSIIHAALEQGADPRQFLGEILDQLRALLLLGMGSDESLAALGAETIDALRRLLRDEGFSGGLLLKAIRAFQAAGVELRTTVRPQLPLELALVETVLERAAAEPRVVQPSAPGAPEMRPVGEAPSLSEVEEAASAGRLQAEQVATPRSGPVASREAAPEIGRPSAETAPPPPGPAQPVALGEAEAAVAGSGVAPQPRLTLDWVRGKWPQVLAKMGVVAPNIQAALRTTVPVGVQGDVLLLACESSFTRDTLADPKRSGQVEQILAEVMGVPCRIACRVGGAQAGRAAAPEREGAPTLFPPQERPPSVEEELRNHPFVKALEQRGGQVTRIELDDERTD